MIRDIYSAKEPGKYTVESEGILEAMRFNIDSQFKVDWWVGRGT